jgi:NAD(P)-dependent dehydrogenase (short-subunit alcohol dehydrogenase family)
MTLPPERPIRFDGQVAVVTGAGRGLGAAYARLLASLGAAVVVHDAGVDLDGTGFDPAPADGLAHEITEGGGTAVASHEDLQEDGAAERVIAAALARFGAVDVLISNAGLLGEAPIDELDPRTWRRMMRVNVEAPFLLCRAAFPLMRSRGYGRIVLTTSGRALYVNAAIPHLTAYSVGKGAQLGLMVGLAAEGEPHGIRTNTVSPVASTRMTRQPPPPGPLAPELVAPGVAFLASSACQASGVILRAAGGRFSAARFDRGEDVDFGPRPVPPDAIAGRWAEVLRGPGTEGTIL